MKLVRPMAELGYIVELTEIPSVETPDNESLWPCTGTTLGRNRLYESIEDERCCRAGGRRFSLGGGDTPRVASTRSSLDMLPMDMLDVSDESSGGGANSTGEGMS